MPQCVTPDRLMQYLTSRNPKLDARYRDIAALYKRHGEALAIRWDYAFFQMLLETNNLTFTGDVRASRTTSPASARPAAACQAESFQGRVGRRAGADAAPSSPTPASASTLRWQRARARTRTTSSRSRVALRRAVRFSDLTNRWAADSSYARSMDILATRFRETYCTTANKPPETASTWRARRKRRRPKARRASAAHRPRPALRCDIWSASYGGTAALLIRCGRQARSITPFSRWSLARNTRRPTPTSRRMPRTARRSADTAPATRP